MTKMHDDELDTSVDLVRQLLSDQAPDSSGAEWIGLPLVRAQSTGTANAMYRMGEDLAVRLPLRPGTEASVRKELRWVPELAFHLPLAVPAALMVGEPTEAFPMPWSVQRWLEGEDGTVALFDEATAARDLAGFLRALHDPALHDLAPSSDLAFGSGPSDRGGPLAARDRITRSYAEAARHLTDADAVLAIWDDALAAPVWGGPGCWIHGDIASGNLLFADGRLTAAIDWSALAVGDPAADVLVAWEMFGPEARAVFRAELAHIDDATWARARGWAVSTAILCLPYYEHTNQFMVDQAKKKINALIADR